MKNILYTLVLLFLANNFVYAQLKEFEITEMAHPEVPIVQANTEFGDDALIIVYSSLDNLNFRSSVGGLDRQNYNTRANRYEILVKPLKQMILVSSGEYMEQKIATINPKPKQDFYYKVEEKLSDVLKGKGLLKIETQPTGCEISLNGLQLMNRTPFSQEIPAGANRITLRKERYVDLDTTIRIKPNENTFFDIKMKPGWAELDIKTDHKDAQISLNGQQKGFGLLNFRGIEFGLKPDRYNLSISLDKYRTYNKTLNLRAGQIENLDIQLEPITGKLGIVSNPPDADVILNGKKVGTTPYNSQLIIGDYEVEVVKAGHKEEKYSFQMRDGDYKEFKPELKNYSIALNPLKSKRKFFGYLSIASALAGGYFYYSSYTGYAAYPDATDKAEKLRKQVVLGDIMYPAMFGLAVAALVPTISYSVKIHRLKKEWGLVAVPSPYGANLGFAYKF